MQCFVYKSPRRADTYVFLPQRDDFSSLPAVLRERLGTLQRVMQIELQPGRRLARGDADTVMKALAQHGFHLQVPPAEVSLLHAVD